MPWPLSIRIFMGCGDSSSIPSEIPGRAGDDEEMADKVGHDGARVMKKR